jgi:hypothetical protein
MVMSAIDRARNGNTYPDPSKSVGLLIHGDSTGDETTEWPYLLSQYLAGLSAKMRLQYRLWDDATQDHGAWTALSAGDLGERHILFDGSNNPRYLPFVAINALTGDIEIRAKLSADDWTPSATKGIASTDVTAPLIGFNFFVRTTGVLSFQSSNDGTNLTINQSTTNPLGFTDGATKWLRVTVDVDNGASGHTVTFYSSDDGVAWTTIDTKTGAGATSIYSSSSMKYYLGGSGVGNGWAGKIYECQIRNGIGGPIQNPQPIEAWLPVISPGTSTSTIGGSPTIYVVNSSKAGAGFSYLSDTTRFPKMMPPYEPAVIILNDGHNETDITSAAFIALLDAWKALVVARMPAAGLALITQNPETRSTPTAEVHGRYSLDLMPWGRRNGFDVIDTYRAFLRDGRPLTTLINSDGVHPDASGGGRALLASAVIAAFEAQR